jgi:LacI family transcriptional regulator
MSIQTLADSLGLSISTVSRALNGYTDVSAKTRARVEAAAKAMNYRPDPMAHRLATGRTGAVALVFTASSGSRQDAILASLMSGATEEMRQHKLFTLALWLPSGDEELPELDRLLAARLVDGVMLIRPDTFDGRVALLQERNVPLVTYGRTLDNALHAWVDIDNVNAVAQATAHLVSLGHRRIALLTGPSGMSFAVQRQQGFEQGLKTAGIDLATCPVANLALTSAAGTQAAMQLLGSNAATRPSAFVCVTDTLALGVYQAAEKRGLQVGRDVSVIGFGNSSAADFADPPLASIDQAILDSGRNLARTLLQVMQDPSATPPTHLEKPKLVLRASVGPCYAAP